MSKYAFPAGSAPGMTLRDWFAGMALTGHASNPNITAAMAADVRAGMDATKALAIMSYEIADAMLAERAKGAGQ